MRATLTHWLKPRWLRGMVWPTLMLWLYALALSLASAWHFGGPLPPGADYASRAALPLIMAWWVTADARKRQRPLCYDYDGFVFFAWPVVVPIYLFRTRGWRAFLTLLCFAGIWAVAAIAVAITLVIREFAYS